MQIKTISRHKIGALIALSLLLLGGTTVPAEAAPIIDAFAGSGTNTFYFALDFRDFAAPQSYAFGFRSNANTLTFAEVLQGLDAGLTDFSIQAPDFPPFGLSLNGIRYGTKEKYNDFAGNNSGEPNGYWAQWNSLTGVDGSWASNNSGISGQNVSAGNWVGASWTSDFTTVTDAPPRVRQVAVPEAGTVSLLATGTLGLVAVLARRKRTA